MEKRDLPKLVELVSALASSFGREADEPLLLGYELGLEGLPIDAIQSAVARALRTCRFMPSPAELRDLAGELQPQARAIKAFQALEKAVCSLGWYKSPNFDCPVLNAAVRNLGGWQRICELTADEFDKWFRKDFERVYTALLQAGVSAEESAPLVGGFERENARLGYEGPKRQLVITGLPPLQIAQRDGGEREMATQEPPIRAKLQSANR